VANAAGLQVAVRGMRGHRCRHVNDVLTLWDHDELLAGDGLVDYVLGAEPGSGAFVVGHCDDPVPQQYLKYFKMGDGPFYVFYTPWHLPHAEAPLTAARAALFHDPSVTPIGAPRCDVVAIAKRDLRPGEILDGIGGYMSYGAIENYETSRRERLLPMGLAVDCTVVTNIAIDEPIHMDDVERPPNRTADDLRRQQDERFGPAGTEG
jgi:predicted homoserine dehydrogenase-like protein